MIRVLVTCDARDLQSPVAGLREELERTAREAREEPGCLEYSVSATPDGFLIAELWRDRVVYAEHHRLRLRAFEEEPQRRFSNLTGLKTRFEFYEFTEFRSVAGEFVPVRQGAPSPL